MAYTTGTLTGTYQLFDGTPARGKVEIIPNSRTLVDAEGDVILSGRVKVTLDDEGSFSVVLPATDDETVQPAADRQYTVTAKLNHAHLSAVTLELPAGETVDMADVTGAEAVQAAIVSFLTEDDYTELVERVDDVDTAIAAVPTTYAQIGGAQKADQLVDEIKRGKFGKIGTAGKAVIALRYDHQLDAFRSTILPLLKARFLPASMGIVTQAVGQAGGVPGSGYEPTTTTWAQIQSDLLYWGVELWAHSRTHADPISPATLYDEIVGAKTDIETNLPKARVMGWQQPGGPSTYGEPHTSAAGMDDEAGRIIRDNYGLYETNVAGSIYRGLPTDGCRGHNHLTLDTLTLTVAKAAVDNAIELGVGLELMTHPAAIGTVGHMSLADYTALLDYIVTKRDAGLVEVLTASGLAFADPSSTHRPSLIPYGDFEGVTTGTPPAAYVTPGAAWTIQTDGGHAGSNYLRIPAGQATVSVRRPGKSLGLEGHAVMFEGWYRSLDGGTKPDARVMLRGSGAVVGGTNDTGRDAYAVGLTTSSWQRLRYVTTLPVGYNDVLITFGKGVSTGTIDWDDVRVVAI